MSQTANINAAAQAAAPAARIGAELRVRRDSLGWKLSDLAASLRIRPSYLEAIEAGRIADLPGTTYALGFVRAYAAALGLPGEEVASRFRAESADAGARPALSFPAPVPQRGVPAGALMLLGLVILAGAYSGWYYVSEHQRTPPETVPAIPDRLLPPAAEKPTPSPQVASILPTASPPTQPAPPPVAAPGSSPSSGSPQAPAGLAPAVAAAGAVPSGKPSQPAAAPVVQPPASALVPTAPDVASGRIVVQATALSWVTVKPKTGGGAVFNKLMHAGDSWVVPADSGILLLTTGNAGGTHLLVDGAPVTALGPSGTVFRDLPLDAELLKSGHLPPSRPSKPKPVAEE